MKWTDRVFRFGIPEGWLFNILERLAGTVPRIRTMVGSLPEALTRYQPEGRWSIREHIGHLADLEELHAGRLDDFIARRDTLRPADMSNLKTVQAQHNTMDPERLIHDLESRRNQLIDRLLRLDDDTQRFLSLHPRLQVMIKPVDMAFFTAEHDDHHLASIREIVRMGNGA